MFRRLAVIAAAMVLAITLSPQPVQASWNACDWGRFCMWDNENYWGEFSQVLYPTGQCINSSMSNRVSSVRNNRPLSTYIHEGPCWDKRKSWLVSAGQSYSPMPSGWNNAMQSFTMME